MQYIPLKVKDMSLADWDRTEIKIAEAEMPGLMALREEFVASKLLNKIVAALHLEKIGLENETRTDQAAYTGVKVEGPFKLENYRY